MKPNEAAAAREVRGRLTKEHLRNLYQAARLLDLDTRCRLGLRVPCEIYVQDRVAAEADPALGVQTVDLAWEPVLADGPTSARLAVVDYDGDTGTLAPPAHWDEQAFTFKTPDGKPVAEDQGSPQFRQVNAWATVTRVLEYYEDPAQLGRPIPWGFEGNRLMIVPQAGFRENAFYDRHSKSLQLYYYADAGKPSYASLSHDIVAHECAHAVLDGIRPYFLETSSWETAAFHEFVGDLTAILLALRNNDVRANLQVNFGVDVERALFLAGVAEEFGQYVENRPFLRTAKNSMTFAEARRKPEPHDSSQLLTGAMFDILAAVAHQQLSPERQAERDRPATPAEALWWAAERMGGRALQPLDLLPPVDVRFLDYARAVLRNDELADPEDRHGNRRSMREVFHRRGLCPRSLAPCAENDAACGLHLPAAPRLRVFHDVAVAARCRTAAYRLVHDNRGCLGIPWQQDFTIADVYESSPRNDEAERLPRRVVIEYVWREAVALEGERFGRLAGETVDLLCGGTLVFDDRGNLLWWAAKPGSDRPEGPARRAELLDYLASIVAERRLTLADEGTGGPLVGRPAAVVARRVGRTLRLETGFHLCGVDSEGEEWTTSF